MNNYRLRDAIISDLPAVVDIYNSTIPSRMVTADTEIVSVESKRELFMQHIPDQLPLWIIEQEDKTMLGWVSLQPFYGRPAYKATAEISIYLAEPFRGKGLGSDVHAESIVRARHIGIKTLLGYIFAHNEPSIKLFKRFGFEEWATLPNIAMLDGVERSLKILGKRIEQ